MTEAEVTALVEEHLNEAGIFWWKNWAGGVKGKSYSKKGVADILGISSKWVQCRDCGNDFLVPGIFMGIELKATGKKPTKPNKQTEFIDSVNRQGGVGFFADCLEDVVERLK